MTHETANAELGRTTTIGRVLAGGDWLINSIIFPIRLRRWYYFNVSSKRCPSGRFPLEYSLRTHFIGAVVIRNHPVRVFVPERIRKQWQYEVSAALAGS